MPPQPGEPSFGKSPQVCFDKMPVFLFESPGDGIVTFGHSGDSAPRLQGWHPGMKQEPLSFGAVLQGFPRFVTIMSQSNLCGGSGNSGYCHSPAAIPPLVQQ
jgi:hypothetical protein